MKRLILPLLLFLSSTVFSQPAGYYDSATGTGSALKTQLYNIISSHTALSYDNLWSAFYSTDVDNYYENDGTVLDMYSENPSGTDPYNYNFGSDQCGTYSNEGDCYNREHSFPKSWFNDASPMYTDLFHLYPTDGKVNGYRSNYPFGEVSSPTWTSQNGSKLGPCSYPGYTGTVFEPIDEFKGDFARTYFYMATCYEDKIDGWSSAVLNGTSYPCYTTWFMNMLLDWNAQDPVSQKEIDRNDAVYAIQGNRNPFIDHPEWAECIWNNNCVGVIAFTSSPVTTALTNQTYTYNITYTVTDETETITCPTKPAWLSFSSNTTNNTGLLTGSPSDGDIGTHNVSLKLSENGSDVYQNFTIEVGSDLTVDIINEDFTTCPANDWTIYSVTSNKDWECGTNTDMYINGYGGDAASDDWFISPVINLNNYTNEVLTFETYTKYSDAGVGDPEVKLMYSVNYSGSGDPGSATWTEIAYTFPSEDSQTWTASGNIDLSGINGTDVYLAFQYTSSGTASGTSALWELDNILLTGDQSSGGNTLPEFTSTPVTSATSGQAYTYNITATDTDGDELSFTALTKPAWLTLTDYGDGTAELNGTPTNADAGANIVSISVSDGTGNVNQDFTITVTAVNTAPEFTSTPGTSATAGQVYTYNITANDADGDNLSFTAPAKPSWLTLTDNGNGTAVLSGTPTNDNAGDNAISLSVSDGSESANQNFNISVTASGSVNSNTNSSLNLFPNPAQHNVNISSSLMIKSIELTNILGKTVYSQDNVNTKTMNLNLKDYAKGIYIIKINDIGNNTVLKKLIIK